jgi:hypothetical protein
MGQSHMPGYICVTFFHQALWVETNEQEREKSSMSTKAWISRPHMTEALLWLPSTKSLGHIEQLATICFTERANGSDHLGLPNFNHSCGRSRPSQGFV